jgi:DNA-binding LacI/PurR family transcriptional regulator
MGTGDKKTYIYDQLLARIVSGEFKPGDKLPTERDLAAEYKSSLWSVHNAMGDLESNDFIERRRAVGTFVKKNICMEKASRQNKNSSKEVNVAISPNFFYMRTGNDSLVKSLEKSLEAEGFNITYIEIPNTVPLLRKSLLNLQNGSVRALVIIPERQEWVFLYNNVQLLMPHAHNIFCLNRGIGELNVFPMNGVAFDPLEEARRAILYLWSKNISNINYVSVFNKESYWLEQRRKGFNNIAGNLTPKLMSKAFLIEFFSEVNFKPVATHIAESEGHQAFVCCTDEVAGRVIDYISSFTDFKPGVDYSIIGFGDHPVCRMYNLTTVAPSLEGAGEAIVMAIKERGQEGDLDISRQYVMNSYVIERKTVRMDNGSES